MTSECPICARPAERGRSRDYGERLQYICSKCGSFEITRTAQVVAKSRIAEKPSLSQLLSFAVRQLQQIEAWPTITSKLLDDLTANTVYPSPRQQSDSLLLWLQKSLEDPSAMIDLDRGAIASIVGATSEKGVDYLIGHLAGLGLVRAQGEGKRPRIGLTVDGWTQIERGIEQPQGSTPRVSQPAVDRGPPEPVYPVRITVADFRCFKEQQCLDLTLGDNKPARWTLLLGDNGVGKTTLLQCIAALFPTMTYSGSPSQPRLRPYLPLDRYSQFASSGVRVDSGKMLMQAEFQVGPPESPESKLISVLQIGRKLDPIVADARRRAEGFIIFGLHGSGAQHYFRGRLNIDNPSHVAGYGASRLTETQATQLGESPEESESAISLFSVETRLRSAEEWILQADYTARMESQDQGIQRARLDRVQQALLKILPSVKTIKIHPAEGRPSRPRVTFGTAYGDVPFGQLSLGYQATVAWVVDLARQLFDRYPDVEEPLSQPVTVLIDEIDLHLHPKWQRQIMSLLSDRRPLHGASGDRW